MAMGWSLVRTEEVNRFVPLIRPVHQSIEYWFYPGFLSNIVHDKITVELPAGPAKAGFIHGTGHKKDFDLLLKCFVRLMTDSQHGLFSSCFHLI
jgi:hypothetical protein